MLQAKPNRHLGESKVTPKGQSGLNDSYRYHSNSARAGQPISSSRYRPNNLVPGIRSGHFSASTICSINAGKGEVAIIPSRKQKSPKNVLPKERSKPQSIFDLVITRSPARGHSRSPEHHQPLFLKQLQSVRNNHHRSFSSARNHNTTNMRSQRNNIAQLRNVQKTQIIPVPKLGDSSQMEPFLHQQTPNKYNDSQLHTKLFRPKRNRPTKLHAQGLQQKLRNLLSAHKGSDQQGEIINDTRDTRQHRRADRNMTEPKEERIQFSQRLKWKSYLFDLRGYSYVKQLGKGGYARVILCRHDQTNQLYAVKIYDKLLLESRSKISNIKRELAIMSTIRDHQSISSLRESIQNKTTTFIVMEYCKGHSLFSEIKGSQIQRIPQYRAKCIFRQLLDAMLHLKKNKIAHRDIKAENILVNGPDVKLIDFGFSVFCQRHELIETFCGTPTYMAPEIVSRQPYNPFKSDVWSLGVLLYLMLHGVYPFFSQDETVLFNRIQKGKYKLDEFLSKEVRQLMRWMLVVDPEERIDIEDIPQSSWL